MTTFHVPTRDEVSPANQDLFDTLKRQVGFVPNLYATFALSNNALGTYLALQGAKSSIHGKAREVVNLVVSQVNECEYCLAAHTAVGGMLGFKPEQILEIRSGRGELRSQARRAGEVSRAASRCSAARRTPLSSTPSSPLAGRRKTSSTRSWRSATRSPPTTCIRSPRFRSIFPPRQS